MTISADTLRGTILKQKRERVELPEFGEAEFCWMHGMTAKEKTDLDAWALNKDLVSNNTTRTMKKRERMVVFCMRDSEGNRLLSYEDIPVVQGWPEDVVDRLSSVALKLCSGKNVEEQKKTLAEATDD